MLVPPVVTELADGAAELVTLETLDCALTRFAPRQLSVKKPMIIRPLLVLILLRICCFDVMSLEGLLQGVLERADSLINGHRCCLYSQC